MPIILTLIIFTVWIIPISVGLILIIKPCLPPFIGSMLPFCWNGAGFPPWISLRILLATIEALMFLHVCAGGSLIINHILFSPTLAIWNYITVIRQM
jgi:hypothetical protein